MGRRILHAVGERLDFTHDLIREVSYTRILFPYRTLHETVARAMEEWFERFPTGREQTEQVIGVRFELRQSLFVLGDIGRMLCCLSVPRSWRARSATRSDVAAPPRSVTHCLSPLGRHDEALEAGQHARAVAKAAGVFPPREWSSFYLAATYDYLGGFAKAVDLLRSNVTALTGDLLVERFALVATPISVVSQAYLALALTLWGSPEEAEAWAQPCHEPHRGARAGA